MKNRFRGIHENIECKTGCEKQESNLRTPARTDLESASVDHLDILAQNNMGYRIVKAFDNSRILCQGSIINLESASVDQAWIPSRTKWFVAG